MTAAPAPCEKVGYATKRGAKAALASCRESWSPNRRERRFYRCPRCGCWHLTSTPDRAPQFERSAR